MACSTGAACGVGCGKSCSGNIENYCSSGCGDTCHNTCKDGCAGNCKNGCYGCRGCTGSCAGGCSSTATYIILAAQYNDIATARAIQSTHSVTVAEVVTATKHNNLSATAQTAGNKIVKADANNMARFWTVTLP